MELYRIFYTFRTRELNFVTITGMDMIKRRLFSVLVYSANDEMDLNHPLSPDIPDELQLVLKEEKSLIDQGYYDLITFQTNVLH